MTLPVHEPANPFAGLDVPWLLKSQAVARPDKTLLTWVPFDGASRSYTYAAFHDLVRRVAAGLRARGVAEGVHVLVHLENCPEFLIAWFALAELGAVAVTTNTRSSVRELAYFIGHSGCSGAITQPALAARVAEAGPHLSWLVVTGHDAGQPPDEGALPARADRFDSLTAHPPLPPGRVTAPDPARPVSVQYTSGTTSRPKGVVITHANALWAGQVTSGHQRLRDDDVHLVCAPLFHVNALGYSFLPSLWMGASVVLMPRFSTRRFWQVANDHGTTWASMIFFFVRALGEVEAPARHPFRAWGGGFATPPLAQRLGIAMFGWYGMTETISQPITGFPNLPNRPLCIGRAAPEYGVRVLNDAGGPAAVGEAGHLRVRGVRGLSLFAGYLNDEAATAKAFDEHGWFITGDLVVPLEDGSIRFSDRDKDMLKVGGENVAASEVEAVIAAIDGVAEVAVVGKPHPMLDEVPVAFIRPMPSLPDAARRDLAGRVAEACGAALADFKCPREVLLIDEFPRAVLNKIAKARLRARLIDRDIGDTR